MCRGRKRTQPFGPVPRTLSLKSFRACGADHCSIARPQLTATGREPRRSASAERPMSRLEVGSPGGPSFAGSEPPLGISKRSVSERSETVPASERPTDAGAKHAEKRPFLERGAGSVRMGRRDRPIKGRHFGTRNGRQSRPQTVAAKIADAVFSPARTVGLHRPRESNLTLRKCAGSEKVIARC